MNELANITLELYAYCTDFIINLANLLGVSYYEINAVVFCFIYPVVLISLIVFYIKKSLILKSLIKRQS